MAIDSQFIDLSLDGLLTIKSGYAWDGPSGPTIDTKNFIRGSLVHDALYQILRDHDLVSVDRKRWRQMADEELRRICLEDGMWRIRAAWVYRGVRIGGRRSARRGGGRKVLTAPAGR